MRRGLVIGIGAGVVAAVGAAVAIGVLVPREAGPEQTLDAYLAALADGDPDAAAALVDDLPAGAADAFSAAAAYLDDVRAGDVDRDADAASAQVDFRLDGDEHRASIALVRTADGWRVSGDGLGTLTATTTLGDAVSIGTTLLATGEAHALLPALYDIRPAPAGLLEGAVTAAVLPGEDAAVDLTATPAPDAAAAAQDQLDGYLADCTRTAAAIPPACGIRLPWEADFTALESVSYRIEKLPTVALGPAGTTFAATSGALVATVSGAPRGGGSEQVTYRTDAWALYGTVEFSGGEMILAVR